MSSLMLLLALAPTAGASAPTATFEVGDLDALRAEDRLADVLPGSVWRFGVPVAEDLSSDDLGEWSTSETGERVWRATVVSPGAHHLNVLFDDLHLVDGATLTLSTDRDVEVHQDHTGPLGTRLLRGDELHFELVQPAGASEDSFLTIDALVHGYRNAFGARSSAVGASGSCNVNAACESADGWRTQVPSAVILNLGFGLCSGTLVNNTNQDQRPYILTAYHCYEGTNTNQWQVGFNYESDGCSNPNFEPSTDVMYGATLRAAYSPTDMALVELQDSIPDDYEAFYAGWDATGDTPAYTAGIHHPNGDIKKFSYDDDAPFYSQGYWSVVWDLGTTEGGSSGSGLFDDQGRIIGHLLGGNAACNNPNGSDSYGAVSADWNGGGNANSRLSDHLDPLGLNPGTWDGFGVGGLENDAAIELISPEDGGTSCGESAVVRITNRGQDDLTRVDLTVVVDGDDQGSETWRGRLAFGETEDFALSIEAEGDGSHSLEITASNPNGEVDEADGNNEVSGSFSLIEVEGAQLPLNLDFEDSPSLTTRQEPVAGATWELVDLGEQGIAAGMNNLEDENIDHIDALVLGTFDLSKGRKPKLVFDLAYAQYGEEYEDGLRVVLRNECDGVETVVWEAYGPELATAPMTEDAFVPTEDQWERIRVDLADFDDQIATVELQNVGGWGQWLYVDNVELDVKTGILGCGCDSAPAPSLAWLGLPLGLLLVRRRR